MIFTADLGTKRKKSSAINMYSLVFLGILVVMLTTPYNTVAQNRSNWSTYGGGGGKFFTDRGIANSKITGIAMECGRYLSSIQVRYGSRWGKRHGWKSYQLCKDWDRGKKVYYGLWRYEYITGAFVTYDKYVRSITWKTNRRTLPTCGTRAGRQANVNGRRLKFIAGKSGCIVDRLSLYWPRF